jgi:hypothetical protein
MGSDVVDVQIPTRNAVGRVSCVLFYYPRYTCQCCSDMSCVLFVLHKDSCVGCLEVRNIRPFSLCSNHIMYGAVSMLNRSFVILFCGYARVPVRILSNMPRSLRRILNRYFTPPQATTPRLCVNSHRSLLAIQRCQSSFYHIPPPNSIEVSPSKARNRVDIILFPVRTLRKLANLPPLW